MKQLHNPKLQVTISINVCDLHQNIKNFNFDYLKIPFYKAPIAYSRESDQSIPKKCAGEITMLIE